MSLDTQVYLESAEASNLNYITNEVLTVNASNGALFESVADYWSEATINPVEIKPDGILTGLTISPGAANDQVSITAGTVQLAGATASVSADSVFDITRGTTNGYKICAVTINSSGVLTEVEGTESTAFDTTRGAAGGPPYIPVGSVLVGYVYLTSTTAALITSDEIRQLGSNRETATSPTYTYDITTGSVTFDSIVNPIHTGDVPKSVYASYAPVTVPSSFTLLQYTDSYKGPEDVYSSDITKFHNNQKLANVTNDLSDCTFNLTFERDYGIGSFIEAARGDKRWLYVKPDQYRSSYILVPAGVVSIEKDEITAEESTVSSTISILGSKAQLLIS